MDENLIEHSNRHPAEVLLSVERWLKEGNPICEDSAINWLGMAEIAAFHACEGDVLESILWGRIAVTVREALAKSQSDKPSALVEAMLVRSNLIMRFGNHPGDPLCDSKIVLEWLLASLPMSLEDARVEAEIWHAKPDERKFEFKWIIQELETIRDLVAHRKLEADCRIHPWLDLLEQVRPSCTT